jgi:cation:H+ antiporter
VELPRKRGYAGFPPVSSFLQNAEDENLMAGEVGLLIAGLFALTAGADILVRGSASLAFRLGLTPLVIGLTVVAFGTSMPEMVVSIFASLSNQGDISVGNVIGSNIFNIGIILGITALVCPVKTDLQVIKSDGPIMLAASLICVFMVAGGSISRAAGVGLFAGLLMYVGFTVWMAWKDASSEIMREFQEGVPSASKSMGRDLMFIGGGLFLLVAGSRVMVVSSTEIARVLGISEAVIGLTIVAAGTSMPELATSVAAALRRQPDIAVGNVIGSNIFNIFGILGITSIIRPININGITALDGWVMVAFAIALLPLLFTRLILQRWEGGLLLLGYCVYLWHLWPSG